MEKLFCNERTGEYRIAKRLSRSIGFRLQINIKYHQLHNKDIYF